MKSESIVLAAGGLAFVGSFKDAGGFPANGYTVISATVALVFLASMTDGTAFDPAIKGLAGLMLLGAAYYYIPAFTKKSTKKGKVNG
jgi:hypothetical protein